MLILSRHKDEQIVIPEQSIVVTVIDIRGDKVRIGIEAPANVPVHRREVWERVLAEQLRCSDEETKPLPAA